MDSVTAKYNRNASLLLSTTISPALAARHAARARSSPSSQPLSPLHCPRCAHLSVTTRVVANSKRRRTSNTKNTKQHTQTQKWATMTRGLRVQRSCAVCGYVGAQAVERCSISVDTPPAGVSLTASPAEVPDGAAPSSSVQIEHVPSISPTANKEAETSSTNSKGKALASAIAEAAVSRNSTPSVGPAVPQRSNPASKSSQSQSAVSFVKRQRKKAGLQEMLARSKEQKQSIVRNDGEGQEGSRLAAFLSGL